MLAFFDWLYGVAGWRAVVVAATVLVYIESFLYFASLFSISCARLSVAIASALLAMPPTVVLYYVLSHASPEELSVDYVAQELARCANESGLDLLSCAYAEHGGWLGLVALLFVVLYIILVGLEFKGEWLGCRR